MKIDILCSDGSPLGITYADIHGHNGRVGVGGAELAVLTLAEGWTNSGHKVTLYNDPKHYGQSPFEHGDIERFDKLADRDVLIVFRSPTPKIVGAKGYKVWFSCDQFTMGDFKHFAPFADKIVTISPFHSHYFVTQYGIENTIPIDLPVRSWEYGESIEKVPNRLIFTSVPDRGLAQVAQIFPHVRDIIPDASLVITSDYRLWGSVSPVNEQFVRMFMRQNNTQFLGAISRERLIQEQLKAQIHVYPFSRMVSEELFCIAIAESQVAGVLPISTMDGALGTTNMGILVDGDGRDVPTQRVFVEKIVEYLQKRELPTIQRELQAKARERFALESVLAQWDVRVFNNV